MPVTIKNAVDIKPSEITNPAVFHNRRRILKAASLALGTTIAPPFLMGKLAMAGEKLADVVKSDFTLDENDTLSSLEQITTYNNFYELGTDKGDPAENADQLVTDPWSVEVSGACDAPGKGRP